MGISAGFFAAAAKAGRAPQVEVSITLDFCANSYGVAPCTAAAGTGLECYNTIATCQDTANYSASTKTYRFALARSGPLPSTDGEIRYPVVRSVSAAPTKITPGNGLGQIGTVNIILDDFTDDDFSTDPYIDTRAYIARDNGTFFGKLLARNPYFEGRPLKIKFIYGDEYAEQEFIIDRFERKSKGGQVTIVGKDPLTLASAIKAQYPPADSGILASNITSGSTTFTMSSDDAADYPTASTYYTIGNEIIKATRSGTTFTITGRAQRSTINEDHSIGDVVQRCVVYDAAAVDDVLYDLIVNGAGVSSSVIPTTEWGDEVAEWLPDFAITATITKPESVNDLLDSFLIELNASLWWSAFDSEIKFKVDSPTLPGDVIPTYTDTENIIRDTADVKIDPKQRVSEVWFYYGIKDPTRLQDDPTSFTACVVKADVTSEGAQYYGTAQIKKVFCRWIDTLSNVNQTAGRYLSRFRHSPNVCSFRLDPQDFDLVTGQHFVLNTKSIQGPTGQPKNIAFVCVSTQPDWENQQIIVEGLQFRYEYTDRGAYVNDDAAPDYMSASAGDKVRAYICDSSTLKMSNGDAPYQIV